MSKAMRRPVPLACSATAVALLLIVAGASGFTMNRHDAFVAGTRWAEGPIWWQVAVGVALLGVSAWLWRRAMRSLHV